MSGAKIAQIYAKAYVGALDTESDGKLERDSLVELIELIKEHKDLGVFLGNQTIAPLDKIAVLDTLLARIKAPDSLNRLLRVIAKNRRLPFLSAIHNRILELLDERAGITTVSLATAHKMTARDQSSFSKKLGAAMGTTINLELDTDPNLLGGAVAQIGSKVFDGSVRGRLDRMRRQLIKE